MKMNGIVFIILIIGHFQNIPNYTFSHTPQKLISIGKIHVWNNFTYMTHTCNVKVHTIKNDYALNKDVCNINSRNKQTSG